MTTAQFLLSGGVPLIDPTIPVDGYAIQQSYNATRGPGTIFDETYVFPSNWKEKEWTFERYFLSTPQYNYAHTTFELYKNGVLIYQYVTVVSPNYPSLGRSWFRDQASALAGSFAANFKGGDTARVLLTCGTRDGSAKPFNVYANLKRTT